ncbi:peptidyl-tRNA hydrolase ICT1, mitochondrial-like isoform X2 [Paramacrobiotus metropolitanus]|uniref:peptidyl-tRNA hydrolase ICT1, mitochondrial-like isoform X2 n=1 Tax=Paramacrobiotus metropolitanus TaxID=2943436 RepID=UPI00244627C6|nr:peptidyl-tRNA hydrolase ICT1, mitochondrial-like isoform X2 [Paramacrobiotus metropolitanus]
MNSMRSRCSSALLLASPSSPLKAFVRTYETYVMWRKTGWLKWHPYKTVDWDRITPDCRTKQEKLNPQILTEEDMRATGKPFVPIDQSTIKISQLVAMQGLEANSGVRYASADNLQKLYPGVAYNFSSDADDDMKNSAAKSDKFHGYIPIDHLKITVSRSSGAGGQNVNKVNTKVEVRFKVDDAWWIPAKLRDLLKEKEKTRITKEGYFYIHSEKTRKQSYNLADCLDKIRFLLRELETPPKVPREEDPQIVQARMRRAASERLREKRDQTMKKHSRRMDFAA